MRTDREKGKKRKQERKKSAIPTHISKFTFLKYIIFLFLFMSVSGIFMWERRR